MRSLLGRFHRPMSRGLVNNMLTMNNLGDGSTLSLDFTTGVLDSRLTFSRASTATFVNSSGYVEYAGANLQRYSETFATTSSAWYHTAGTISTGTSTAPDGTTNCKKCSEPITGTSAANIQLFGTAAGIVQGLPHTITMWVKAGTRSRILFSVDSTSKQIGFDVTAGQTTPTPTVVTGSLLGYSQTPYPDNWYRCSFSWLQVNVSGSYPGFYTATGTGSTYTNSYPCDGSYIEIFGFQLNPGSTAQTYYPTTTAAYHAPRFDYSPTNIGEPRGLLIEGTAINIVKHSNAFTSGDWYLGGTPATLTSNYAVGPDGITGSAWRFQGALSNSVFATPVVNGGAAHVVSIYAKSNTGSNQTFTIYNGSSGTTCTATNVWQRFVVPVAGAWAYAYFGTLGTNQDILIYGAQSELGTSGASSYIPTGASQVTRNPDYLLSTSSGARTEFSIDDLAAGTSALNEHTVLWTYGRDPNSKRDYPASLYARTNANTERFDFRDFSGTTVETGTQTRTVQAVTVGTASIVKIALAQSTSAYPSSAINGTSATLTSGVIDSALGLQWVQISNSSAVASSFNPIWARQLKVYPTALTAAQLQTLTAS